jgi:hypothetical protein
MEFKNIVTPLGLGLLMGGLLASGAGAASLFLSDWGISYGNWAPNQNAPDNFFSAEEDWTGGNDGYLDPGFGGDRYNAEFATLGWRDPSYEGNDPAWGGVSDPLRVNSWTQTHLPVAYRYGHFCGRYSIEAKIDRDLLGPVTSYKLHWTMGCGNDAIDLCANPIPEPTSLFLLGGGLALFGIASRLGRRKT